MPLFVRNTQNETQQTPIRVDADILRNPYLCLDCIVQYRWLHDDVAPLRCFRRFYGMVWLGTEQGNQPMTQRLHERMVIEISEAAAEDLNELNSMIRNLLLHISSLRLSLADMRKRTEDGENNG